MTDSSWLGDGAPWLASPHAFATHVRARLAQGEPRPAVGPSDYDLNGGVPPDPAGLKAAAVLIPVVARAQLMVLLTKRTATLARHAGQIAFPGGRVDPDDASAEAAALREAQEEIGLDPKLVTVLGALDTYRSGTGYAITPLIGLIDGVPSLTLSDGEVEDAFEVPLPFLLAPANLKVHSRVWQGAERQYYAIGFGERYIWGVTAGIIANMQKRLG